MNKINFLTIWDKNYFHTILFSVKQINKIYPESEIIIYDWWFTEKQKIELNENRNIIIENWKIINLNLKLKYTGDILLNIYLFFAKYLIFLRKSRYKKLVNRENMLANKVLCFLDYNNKYKENFIFLDWDAFIINKIDFTKIDSDIWLTIRRSHELNFKKWVCRLINSGVIFFLWWFEKNKLFLKKWENEMYVNNEYLIEQSSISRIIEKYNKKLFYIDKENIIIELSKKKISIKPLSCEVYNYNWIEEWIDKNNIKILHFKWWRHTKEIFKELLRIIKL